MEPNLCPNCHRYPIKERFGVCEHCLQHEIDGGNVLAAIVVVVAVVTAVAIVFAISYTVSH